MNTNKRHANSFFSAALLCLLGMNLAAAQPASSDQVGESAKPVADHSAIGPYLSKDVVAVAFVDFTQIDLGELLGFVEQSQWVDPDLIEVMRSRAEQTGQLLDQLTSAGLRRSYVTLRVSDMQHGGPLLLLQVAEGKDPASLQTLLKALFDFPLEMQSQGQMVLAGQNAAHLQAALAAWSDAPLRPEVLASLAACGQGNAGAMLFGDADSRRVLREMLPSLPAPFAELDGKYIADDLAWAGLSVSFPPELGATFTIQANSPAAATTAEAAINKAFALGKGALLAQSMGENAQPGMAQLLQALGRLSPQRDENRVTLSLGDNPQEVAALAELVATPVRAARSVAARNTRINNFKQVGLAWLNYASAHKSQLPGQAILSEEGKPLLSWRVAVLPYMEHQQALYNQFKLDEPWDSPHNLKLAETIPAVYQDPDSARVRKLKHPWYTTMMGVAGKGSVLGQSKGLTYKQITDDTSMTVMLVNVTPERAVPWTKPADWEVDPKQPFAGVERADGKPFVASFADGSVQRVFPNDAKQRANWPKQLTIDGGETVER